MRGRSARPGGRWREVREAWLAGHRRVHRPWVPEPGLWFQWDFGTGRWSTGVATWLFCAWLAWSRFRVVLPIRDKTLPTVIACIDTTLRRFGGCPTYALTDNEKTVTVEHVARIAIRNPDMVAAAGHYGLTVATCLPADAPSKGGSEATVRVAKADLVPTDANLLAAYADWAALEAACEAFCDRGQREGRIGSPGGHRWRCWPRNATVCTACLSIRGPRRSGRPAPLVARSRWCSWSGACTRCRRGWPARRCGCAAAVRK